MITAVSFAQAPELWDASEERTADVWPEYNRHGDVLNPHWSRLPELFPDYQFVLCDGSEVLAEGWTAPLAWDGTVPGLGDGIDDAIARACAAAERPAAERPAAEHPAAERPTALCALAAEIPPANQGRGLAAPILDAMADVARRHGLSHLVAPVRPSLKELYPLTPIERYMRWTRPDGQPFDPWIRVHTRRGGQIVAAIPRSMRITGSTAEWEQWTGMVFPEDGEYTFARGLAPLTIRDGVGRYWEPNVWIVHTL